MVDSVTLVGSPNLSVKVKRVHPDAVLPKYAHEYGDSGFDLYAAEDVIVEPGQTVKVPTGLQFEIPVGYELQIRPRSGVSAKTKLRVSNAPGTVDATYRGEVMVLMDNINSPDLWQETRFLDTISGGADRIDDEMYLEGTYIIYKHDRIAQGIIVPVVRAELVEVDALTDTERGDGGFGSTGVR